MKKTVPFEPEKGGGLGAAPEVSGVILVGKRKGSTILMWIPVIYVGLFTFEYSLKFGKKSVTLLYFILILFIQFDKKLNL